MPEQERKETIKTITGVQKDRVQFWINEFLGAGAIDVNAWEEPAGSGKYSVSGVFKT